jgi:hypothetical protein
MRPAFFLDLTTPAPHRRHQAAPSTPSRRCIQRGPSHQAVQPRLRLIYSSPPILPCSLFSHVEGVRSPCVTLQKTTTSTHHVLIPACTSSAPRSTAAGSGLVPKDLMSATSCFPASARSATADSPACRHTSARWTRLRRRRTAVRSGVQS